MFIFPKQKVQIKKLKILKRYLSKTRLLIIVGLLILSNLLFFIFLNNSNKEAKNGDEIPTTQQALAISLKIPKLNIDAKIESVGLTSNGNMDVPKGPDEVAWFSLGTQIGETGSAVLAGHTNWKNNQKAVFDDLDKLKKGDKIFIENTNGKIISFVVREIRIYKADAYAPEVFTSTTGTHLNLITCTGDWDKITKSSTERLVVFTEMVN